MIKYMLNFILSIFFLFKRNNAWEREREKDKLLILFFLKMSQTLFFMSCNILFLFFIDFVHKHCSLISVEYTNFKTFYKKNNKLYKKEKVIVVTKV